MAEQLPKVRDGEITHKIVSSDNDMNFVFSSVTYWCESPLFDEFAFDKEAIAIQRNLQAIREKMKNDIL